jgi:hypothetical protein
MSLLNILRGIFIGAAIWLLYHLLSDPNLQAYMRTWFR